jgi:uncharacterized membrane protein (DUF4010 family)
MWASYDGTLPNGMAVADAAATLAVALGCGLLVGIERERRKGTGATRALAGVRTFALVCVLGAGGMLSGESGLVAVGALLVAALCVVSHARARSRDPGVTTEVALFLTYLIGVLSVWTLPLAAAMAVTLTALLAARERLHHFASRWLQPGEVRDGIILGALVLIALPLMPDRPLWGDALNPHLTTQLLALLLAIQSLAHLSRRLLEARQAVMLSSIASGFVSSTATIASMGMAVREGRGGARLMAGAGLLSCVATFLQMLVVALAIQAAWLKVLWWPALAGTLVALLWGAWLVRGAPPDGTEVCGATPRAEGVTVAERPTREDRMFSLRGALLVAALLTSVQALVYGLRLWLGQAGALGATVLASVVDLHSSVAAVLALAAPGEPGMGFAALMLAIGVHGVSKAATAGFAGGMRYLGWLAPGLFLHTLACVAGLAWQL